MTEFSIARERVPEKLLASYDYCAKGGKNDKEIDTQEEIAKFFSQAKLDELNMKITNEEYDSFIKEFEAEKKVADNYEKQQYLKWRAEKIAVIKKKIKQLETDIKKFEAYQKENPKTSAMHKVLNKTELVAEGIVGITFVALSSFIPFVNTKAVADTTIKRFDDAKKNGSIQTSEYNKLRAKADYEKLAYLKKLLNDPYAPMMALSNAAQY